MRLPGLEPDLSFFRDAISLRNLNSVTFRCGYLRGGWLCQLSLSSSHQRLGKSHFENFEKFENRIFLRKIRLRPAVSPFRTEPDFRPRNLLQKADR